MYRNHSLAALGFYLAALAMTMPCRAEEKPDRSAKVDISAVVKGNNQFAFELYQQLSKEAKPEENIFFSPSSISTALAMAYAGARAETAEEMAKVLHFTLGQERLHPAFGKLVADLQKTRPYNLHVANALWGQKGYLFADRFLHLTQKHYCAGLKEVDFAAHLEEARLTINRWVEEQTRGMIKELFLPNDLRPLTFLVLTNAIYFKGKWETPFLKDQTKDAVFEVTPTKKVTVAMMSTPKGVFNYFGGEDFQWLELPYQGNHLAIVLLLPQKKGGLAGLEKKLTAAALQEGLGNLRPHLGPVFLPRFKVTMTCHLVKDLKKMGMMLAFSPSADFSGIAPGLRITTIVHKAHINVDEVGTEAAAATGVDFGRGDCPSFSFRADHPFLFLIRDRQTGSILFLGRFTDPHR